jgi:hypothetical protein
MTKPATVQLDLDEQTLADVDKRAERARQTREEMLVHLIGIGIAATKGIPKE